MDIDLVVELTADGDVPGSFVVGAAAVLAQLLKAQHYATIYRLHDLNIRGHHIWILYKDRCGQDIDRLTQLVAITPDAELRAQSGQV